MSDFGSVGNDVSADSTEAPLKRIGLVATDPLRILGLQQMLGTPVDGKEAAAVVPLSVPGVLQDATLSNVLIDATCTGHLFELLTTFRRTRPQIRLIVIGDSPDPDYIQQVIGAGARGYLTHTATEGEIRMALEIVGDGSVWAPRKVLAKLLDASSSFGSNTKEVTFTARETEILALLVEGMGNRDISSHLNIDESTVKTHVAHMMRKAGAKNRVELTMFACRGFSQ